MKPTVGSLFAGIGGFDLGLERAGFETMWQVEIDDYCNKVLEKHWPNVKRYRDVREVGKHNLEPVDLICGGFPCQPFSVAGKRQGDKDDRFLWSEMLRVIAELKPTWAIGENVPGIINMALDDCLSDLEAIGYTTWQAIIPAAGVGAPHRRDRVWIVAHTDVPDAESARLQGSASKSLYAGGLPMSAGRSGCVVADPSRQLPHRSRRTRDGRAEPANGSGKFKQPVGCRHDGLPRGMAGWLDGTWEAGIPRVTKGEKDRAKKLKALGNAVIPQIPEAIGRMILQKELLPLMRP